MLGLCLSVDDDDAMGQNTTQSRDPVTLDIANNEKTSVIEIGSRSPSPALSDVSISR